MKSVWVGMALLTGHSIAPASSGHSDQHQHRSSVKQSEGTLKVVMRSCLQLAETAFARYDKDGSDTLNYEEFIEWARSNREFMLQVEQFRLISEKAIGFEEELSLPDGSDVDSDLEDESQWQSGRSAPTNQSGSAESTKAAGAAAKPAAELLAPWIIEPSHPHVASKFTFSGAGEGLQARRDVPPPVNLELEWIYGANGPSGRNSCRYLCNGDVVFVVSKYAVVYSTEFHRQRFYQGHRSTIACLDVNASGEIVATGDGGGGSSSSGSTAPEIHIWSGVTLQCLAVLQNFHVDGIAQLAFPAPASAASSTMNSTSIPTTASTNVNSNLIKKRAHTEWLVASIGSDANSSMALWDWQHGKLLASGRAHYKSGKRVLAMSLNEDGNEVLVCGVRFVLFHQLDGRFFKHKKPQQMEKKLKTVPACVTTAYYGTDHAVVGTSLGQLFQFQRHKLTKIVQAHSDRQSVNSCLLSCRSMVLFTAGKDGHIKQWDSTLSPIGNPIDLHALVATHTGERERVVLQGDDLRVHSLAYDAIRHKILVGTRMGHILEISDDSSSSRARCEAGIRIIASSHDGQGVSCIAMARTGVNFVSCGATDRSLKVWSLRRRMQIEQLRLKFSPSAAEFSNTGELIAVGGLDGSVLLLQSKVPPKALAAMKNTNSLVTALRFAPQDDILAVACANGLIYLYTLDDNGQRFKRYALLKPFEHESRDTGSCAASSLDFSIDGAFLKSQHCGSVPLRFWDLRQRACERVTAMNAVRNAVWQTYTSAIGWHVSGLRTEDDIRCVQASASQTLLLSMSVRGRLALTHFPCPAALDASQQRCEWLEKAVNNAHLIVDDVRSANARAERSGAAAAGADRLYAGFALNDSIVLSSSCHDGVICQWGVEKEARDEQPRSPCVFDSKMMAVLASFGLEDVYFGWDAESEYVTRPQPVSAGLGIQVAVSEFSQANARRKTEAPDLDLTLAHVYGMNLLRTTLNQGLACAGGNGGFVYATGTLVVVDHVDRRKPQRVFQSGLSHSIACLVKHAIHPFVALGSREDPKLVIWNIDTQRSVAELPSVSDHDANVLVSVAFHDTEHSESDVVAAVWKSRTHVHSLTFYSWKKQLVVAQARMTTLPVLFTFFCGSTSSSDSPTTVLVFVTGGVDHATFWRLDTSCGHLQSQQGVFGRHALVQTLVCGVFVRPFVLTGTVNGSVIFWANGVAAYTLTPPLLAQADASNHNAIVTLVHIPSTRQVIGATQRGNILVWTYPKPTDASGAAAQCRADVFLAFVRSINIFNLDWRYLSSSASSLRKAAQEVSRDGSKPRGVVLVRGLYLLEETNGVMVVLTDGHVVHLDAKMLATEDGGVRTASRAARVVLDHHQEQRDVAVHPRDFLFATCCASGSVCVWNLHTQALAKHRDLRTGVYTVCWNAAGDRLAVSLADGSVNVLDAATLDTTAEFRCGRPAPNASALVPPAWCSKMKYAPVGSAVSCLALACRDFSIYVYSCTSDDKYELMHEFVGHTARIEALDFSLDGFWLQSSSSSLDTQILRWSLRTPENSSDGLNAGAPICSLADDEWSSWGNTFAGPAGGLSQLYGSSVTALDRIRSDDAALGNSSTQTSSGSGRWSSLLPSMAVGTEDGRLLLCWYPLSFGEAQSSISKEYVGFFPADSVVRSVEFSFANGFVVACGRNYCDEAVILVWKTDYEEELHQLERNSINSPAAAATVDSSSVDHSKPVVVDTSLYEVDPLLSLEAKGDEFLAVKPWLGAIREPSVIPSNATSGSLPDQELALEFVYGMNAGATASNNVFYADDSWEIVYAAAAVGVVYNTKTQRQLLNQSHRSNLISAMAVHPKGDLVVTGECGVREKPKLVLWDANSGGTITETETSHERGIRLLGFSPSGDSLVSIGMETEHVMNVFSLVGEGGGVASVRLLTSVKTSKQAVWNLCFTDESAIVTCGNKHILFWQPLAATAAARAGAASGSGGGSVSAGAMSMKKALFTSHKLCKPDANVLAVVHFVKQQVVSSQADGSLYVWKDRRCVDVKLQAHSSASIPTLVVDKKKQLVFSGGSDGKICAWNAQLECVKTLDIAHIAATVGLQPALTSTKIQSLCIRDGRFLVSTAGGEVCELIEASAASTAGSGSTPSSGYRFMVHVRGHNRGELWGLAVHPTRVQFATAGDDGYVRFWDAPTRSLLALHPWKAGGLPRALAFSSDGSHLAAGSSDGNVRVLSAAALDTVVAEWKCSLATRSSNGSSTGSRGRGGGVRVLKYSPDGSWFVVGCQDQRVHVFDAHTYKKLGECRGHSGAVTHLDFSKDSSVLQSVASGAGELLFWHVATRQRIASASTVRDMLWASWSCPFGWPVQGVWPPESDGSDVNAVSRSEDARVVVTGDDAGLVKLFRYPSAVASAAAQARAYTGHASHVTSVAFTRGDLFLLSTGGRDQCVCQFARIGGTANLSL